jgi:hypothetical protein
MEFCFTLSGNMKNKKLTYFLIAAVLGVWGIIFYRIFDAAGSGDNDLIPATEKTIKVAYDDFSCPKDTTKLLLNYKDPFGLIPPKDTIKVKVLPIKNTVPDAKPAMNWSFITYSGYIRNPASKKLIALVSINGQNMAMTEGEVKSQVKLLRNLRDSIKVSYGGKTKFIVIKSAAL